MRPIRTPTTRSATVKPKGRVARFVDRQFEDEVTPKQRLFDLLFVVLFAPATLVVGRVLQFGFISGTLGIIPGGHYLAPLCLLTAVTYLVYRFVGERDHWREALFAGVFGAGALVSGGLGIVLLPLSLIGLFVGFGLLGLVPLLAGFSLARLFVRSVRRAARTMPPGSAYCFAAVVAGLVLVGILGQGRLAAGVSRAHQRILIEDPTPPRRSKPFVQLLWVFPGVDLNSIHRAAWALDRRDPEYERLDELHMELIGEPIPLPPWA